MRSTIFLALLSAFITQNAVPVIAIPLDLAAREPYGFRSGMNGQRGRFAGFRNGPPGTLDSFRNGLPSGHAPGGDVLQRRSYDEDATLEARHNGERTSNWIHKVGGFLTSAVAPGVGAMVDNHFHHALREDTDAALEARTWNAQGLKHVASTFGHELAHFGSAVASSAFDHRMTSSFSARNYVADEAAFERREIDEQELARRGWLKAAFTVGKKLVGAFLKRDMSQFDARDLTADEHAFLHHITSRDLTADEHAFINHISSRGYDVDAEELARRSMSEEELERRSFWKSALKVGGKILGSFLKREDLTFEERDLADQLSDLATRSLSGDEEELEPRGFEDLL